MTNQKKMKRKRKPELEEENVSQKRRTQLYSDFFAIRPPLPQGETESTVKRDSLHKTRTSTMRISTKKN